MCKPLLQLVLQLSWFHLLTSVTGMVFRGAESYGGCCRAYQRDAKDLRRVRLLLGADLACEQGVTPWKGLLQLVNTYHLMERMRIYST